MTASPERAAWGTAIYRPSKFVVHRHQTPDDDHFDVRLQVGRGVVSWLVPAGPTKDPRIPRVARRLPDSNSLAPLSFEGTHAGRGPGDSSATIIWDRGTYQLPRDPRRLALTVGDRLHLGRLTINLHGERLQGGFTFARNVDRHESWLMIKRYDEWLDFHWDHTTELTAPSVVSGRTIDDMLSAASTPLGA